MKSLFTVSLEGYDDITKVIIMDQIYLYSATLQLNVKVLVGASNQEKALVGPCENRLLPMDRLQH